MACHYLTVLSIVLALSGRASANAGQLTPGPQPGPLVVSFSPGGLAE